MSLIISSINWNYKPYDLPALFGQYDPRLCNYRKTRGSRRLARETFGILLSWKRSRSPRHNNFFTDYRDIKFKLTAHRLHSENRNTVLWNKNYRNTAPKITQYRNTANPYAPLYGRYGCAVCLPSRMLIITFRNKGDEFWSLLPQRWSSCGDFFCLWGHYSYFQISLTRRIKTARPCKTLHRNVRPTLT